MKKAIILLAALFLAACGGGGDGGSDPGPLVAEQTDYFDGVTYHRYFRYEGGRIGYATSVDGIHFERYPGNPLMEGSYPVLVEDGDALYLIVRQGNKHNLYDVSVKTKPAFVRTILEGDYCNMAVAVVDGVWHALIEGHDGDYFFLMYSVMADTGTFRCFRGFRGDAGNPTMAYIPERKAILALYGADYKGTGTWRIRAAVYDFKAWTDKGVVIEKPGVHMADPDIGTGKESVPMIITIGYGQNAVSTYLFHGSRLDLYDAVMTGKVSLNEAGVTMK